MQTAKLGNYTVFYENGEEYHRIKREVWGANNYYVELEKENPVIIDAGAHIGLATLYFKKIYPDSKIIALEPFPANAELFRRNIFENQLTDVELQEMALADTEGRREFFFDASDNRWYSTASLTRGAWTGDQQSESLTVETKKLSSILSEFKPDLVKLDIEGVEDKVIWSSRNELSMCPHYLIEFHPIEGVGMDRMVKIFEERGYAITVTKGGKTVPWDKAIGMSLVEAVRK